VDRQMIHRGIPNAVDGEHGASRQGWPALRDRCNTVDELTSTFRDVMASSATAAGNLNSLVPL
jgi:hypothetical protein